MRRFVFVLHDAPSDGGWSLDDLPGSGRADVACRNVQASLCLSHGVRPDVEVFLLFCHPTPRALRLQGARIRRLYPDERSTAARLAKALGAPGAGPVWKGLEPGIAVADLELVDLLAELPGTPLLLDPDGTPLQKVAWPRDPTLFLSDHRPFLPGEERVLATFATGRVSLGPAWYHGNLVAGVVHHALDQVQGAPEPR